MKRLAFLILLGGCGGSSGAGVSTANLDDKGGSLALGAMTVDIPAGALAGPVAFTLTSVTDAAVVADLSYLIDGGVRVFAAPARVTFSLPIGIALPLDELYAAQFEGGQWLALGDAHHTPAAHDGTHGETPHAVHGGHDDSTPHGHVSGSAHGPGHFGVVHCPHDTCPHHP